MELTPSTLREQTRGELPGEIEIVEMHKSRNDLDRHGEVFYVRDKLIFVHERRGRAFLQDYRVQRWQAIADYVRRFFRGRLRLSDKRRRHARFCQSVVEQLRPVANDEPI